MELKVHKQATTAPRVRSEIQQTPASVSNPELAAQYNIGIATVRRWHYR